MLNIVRPRSFAASAAAVAAVSYLTACPAMIQAQSIVNGSFEDPAFAPNSLNEITTTGVPGWTGSTIFNPGGGGTLTHEYVINGNIPDLNGNFFGTTPFGQQYLGLNGVYQNSFRSIESQVVTGLSIGQTYALTIYIANLDGATNPRISLTIEPNATGEGFPEYSATFTAPTEGPYGNGVIDFVPETLTFTATSEVIDFNIGNQSGAVMGIDNVSIAAVPEPTTTSAMVLGFGALTGIMRHRRRATTARPGAEPPPAHGTHRFAKR